MMMMMMMIIIIIIIIIIILGLGFLLPRAKIIIIITVNLYSARFYKRTPNALRVLSERKEKGLEVAFES